MKRLFTIFIFMASPHLWATSPEHSATSFNDIDKAIFEFQQCLIEKGFENIRFKINLDREILIEYENRRYRYELTALDLVLSCAHQYLTPFKTFILVPLHRNIPLVFIEVHAEDYQDFLDQEITAQELVNRIRVSLGTPLRLKTFYYQSEKVNSSFLNFDIVFSPGFKVQFSRPNDPAQLQFNFLPAVSTTIANGLQFQTQFIVPCYNEFGAREARSRLGITLLNQFMRLPGSFFGCLSIGHFDLDRNGFSTEWCKFFGNGRFVLSTKIDYTTLSKTWSEKYQLNYLMKAKYFIPQIDFSLAVCRGYFLLNDKAWRVDIMRSFGEMDLGFTGIWSQASGFLTGLILNIPFPLSQQPLPKKIRLTTPTNVPWKYRYLPHFEGYILDTGTEIESKFKKLTPDFIKNNLYSITLKTLLF